MKWSSCRHQGDTKAITRASSPGRLASQWWGVAAPESTPEQPIGRVVLLFPKGPLKRPQLAEHRLTKLLP
jgi:hypothetical protein